MRTKRNIGVVSFLSIISLISVGFSSFVIVPTDSTTINISTGTVIDLRKIIQNKTISYSIYEDGGGFLKTYSFKVGNTTYYYSLADSSGQFEIQLSCSIYYYDLQNIIDGFNDEFTFYIYLKQSGALGTYDEELEKYTYSIGLNNITYRSGSGSTSVSSYCYDEYLTDNTIKIEETLSSIPSASENSYLDLLMTISFTNANDIWDDITDALENKTYFSFTVGI